jgi:hypothetical protein
MPDPPPTSSDDASRNAFLNALWDELEAALSLAALDDVLDRLPQIQTSCERAAALIAKWQARQNS